MDIKFKVREEVGVPRTKCSINGGIPVRSGLLMSVEKLCIRGMDGMEIPADIEATARWDADKSVKWVRVSFEADIRGGEEKEFLLSSKNSSVDAGKLENNITITDNGGFLTVISKRLKFGINCKEYRIFDYVMLDGVKVVDNSDKKGFYITTEDGRCFDSRQCKNVKISIEEHGRIRAVIRVEGRHVSADGVELFDFMVRYFVFAGSDMVEVQYTFTNKVKQDYVMVGHAGYEIEMPGDDVKGVCGNFGGIDVFGGKFSLLQSRVINTSTLASPVKLAVDDIVTKKKAYFEDTTHHGWIGLTDGKYGVSTSIFRFTENYPKSMGYDGGNSVNIGLWQSFDNKKLEFCRGWAKTHKLFFYFYRGDPKESDSNKIMYGTGYPVLIYVPEEYCASKATGDLLPYSPEKYRNYEMTFVDAFYMWRSRNRSLGMIDYGDFPCLGDDGREDYMSNNEHDFAHVMFLQYMRTGIPEYYLFAEDSLMHTLDIDMVHDSKFPEEVGGVRYHATNHGADYAESPLITPSHMWLESSVEYYYMTGDRRVLELALEIGRNIISCIKRHFKQNPSPTREEGWPLIALTALFEATGRQEIYDACEKIADYVLYWQERLGNSGNIVGFKECLSPKMIMTMGMYEFYCICRDNAKKDRIGRYIREAADYMIEHGMYRHGSMIQANYPGYMYNRFGGDFVEIFGYAYAVTGDKKYIEIASRDLYRCHDVILASLNPCMSKVNDRHMVVNISGDNLAMNWRGLFRFMYWADKSGIGKDLF